MTTDVAVCAAEDNLMRAAELMRQRDCGVIPIVDAEQKLIGMLTDRDLTMAVVARNCKASDVKTGEIVRGRAVSCTPADKLEEVLRKMRKYQIKRLTAVGETGAVVGIVSISDILLAVRKDKDLKKKIQATLRAIFKPRPIVLREISSTYGDSPK